ncbi:DUF1189 domain-containing protein [Clostridium paraputrificum]|uniref:DUF1189 domain-containing protein n=1 Tax=Clostridium TaxID=1485 RepID=UPI003D3580E5
MNKKTNIFVKFVNSLYNIKEFPRYMKEGVGRALLYALVLSLVCGIGTGIVASVNMNKSIKSTLESLKEDKYRFKLQDGILDIETSPLKIEEGNTLVYIDDNITIDKLDELRSMTAHVDSYILLLKDGLSISSDMFPSKVAKYKDMLANNSIDNQSIMDSIEFASKFIGIAFLIMIVVETFLSYLIDVAMIALLAMLTNFTLGINLKYSNMFSLVIYAATLPTVLVTILTVLFPGVYFNSASMVGTLVLTLLVLRNMRKDINENRNIQ